MDHPFIRSPGEWIGQGKITFSNSSEVIRYYTKWIVFPEKDSIIRCEQFVEKEGIPEPICNSFLFSDISSDAFSVILSNEDISSVSGQGLINDRIIAWEFHHQNPSADEEEISLEGIEVYTLQDGGDYLVHAEYMSEMMRTIIDGRIWKK